MSEDELLDELTQKKNSLSTDRMDMSFGEIMNMYTDGEIIIDPEFQRLFRWKPQQQTRFIESVLLGIPIPPIFVAENSDGKWELVDGLQRISTIFSFFGILQSVPEDKNNWKLGKGEIVQNFDGFSCSELPLKLKLNIKRSVCRIEIIRWDNRFIDMRYELFNRLNTGGSVLTDQEIRNCVFRGISNEFNNFVSTEAQNEKFVKLIAPTKKQIDELYLDELILRFCSLYENSESVTTTISTHMTDFMKEAVHEPDKIPYYTDALHRTIDLLAPLGKKIFRGKNYNFSTSLYDGIMIGVAQNLEKYEDKDKLYLKSKINSLKTDHEFIKAFGSTSASRVRIINRLKAAHRVFESD